MSKSAVIFLSLTLLALATLWIDPLLSSDSRSLVKFAAGLFGGLTLVALVIGRRIRFDPQLR